ncbi:MAG: lauroyl acyltransferase [Gammaproteobacteria bacterium]|nr:lauroyl acyltransferase [Gammaproteobacteria bacterium]MAY02932.1 lauroyl acyltransferase [Gammaproteobacteria bacterium]|tara:strand:- start:206 stop:1048 length:843 start_codon:yes stop_codon:yes gene_type:complete
MSLFSLEMARNIGKILGICAYHLKTRSYHTTRTNLRLCYPDLSEQDREQLCRLSLINTGMAMAETGAVWLWPVERIMGRIIDVEGGDLLEKAREAGKGVILIGPHHGNWELIGLYLSTLGPCSQLYLPPKQAQLDKLVYLARKRGGAALYPANSKGVAAVLKALKIGEMTGILPDQIPGPGGGEFAPFFTQQAYTMTLIPRLLQKTGALALLCYALRVEGGFRIVFRQPDIDIYAEHMPKALAALNRTVELAINDAPEQYQWEYKRFRYQPEGIFEPYSR